MNCDVVINLAAETHVTRSINDSRNFLENDIIATDTLLKTCLKNKKLKKFIHISTSEVYGTSSIKSVKMKEEHPLNPLSPYASSKCGADRLVYSYGKTYDFPFTIIRPFNNYGPRQHLEKLIPRFICSILNKKTLTIHGNGKASRDYIYVEDTCEALLKVINTKITDVPINSFQTITNYGLRQMTQLTKIENNIKELKENGYTIIHNVYNKDEISKYKAEFFKWYKRRFILSLVYLFYE